MKRSKSKVKKVEKVKVKDKVDKVTVDKVKKSSSKTKSTNKFIQQAIENTKAAVAEMQAQPEVVEEDMVEDVGDLDIVAWFHAVKEGKNAVPVVKPVKQKKSSKSEKRALEQQAL